MSLKSGIQIIKRIPFVHATVRYIKSLIIDIKAIPKFMAEKRIRRENGPIRVGFICQYLPAWTKVEPVFRLMQADARFEPIIICVPYGIKNSKMLDTDSLENDIYNYIVQQGYSEAINALIGKNEFLDLKTLGLSYIFYPRPYNALLPAQYSSKEVSRYSKICILMYGITFTEDSVRTTLNRDFMSNVYCYFAETPYARDRNIQNNKLGHFLKLQKSVCLGMPVLESLGSYKNEESNSWAFSKNQFRVIWTPRWTTDLADGGSNFFTYYQRLLDYAQEHQDIDFLMRPHPLTFSHFIETGELTEEQVDAYKVRCEELSNVSLDKNSQYEATLWQSSVMISDISAIMPEFFITGKPLIYCASNMILKLAKLGERLVEGCYVVYNEHELFRCLEMLKNGEDPLKQKRQEIIREVFGGMCEGASSNIIEEVAKG